MRPIDFNVLPRATRERFVRSLVSDSPAASPIIRRTTKPRSPALWFVLLVISLLATAAIAAWHFGQLDHPIQDRRFLGAYVVTTALFGLATARLLRRRALGGALPFVPGVYVFPLDLVDARSRDFELYSLIEIVSIEPVHHQRGGQYTHSIIWIVFATQSFTFEVKGRELAESLVSKVLGARQILAAAAQRNEVYELATLDPFAEARARNFEPAHDHGLLARDTPIWTRFVWAITIVSGLVLGVAAWRGRNWQSDERAYARLKAKPDLEQAKIYLAAGGLHANDVKNTIVPRAHLDRAKKETGLKRLSALEKFLKDYPKSTIEPEAKVAFNDALHAHFASQTTVSGLRTFISRWPQSPDVAAAKTKIHELYQDTLVDFRQHANTADKNVVPVVEAMLAFVETQGTPLEVRFRRRIASGLSSTDKLLLKNLLEDDGVPAIGGNAEASVHFRAESIGAREAVLVAGLERGLRRVFPADVLPLRVGVPITDPASIAGPARPLPEVTAPTILVDYEVGWAGTTFLAKDRQRRFLGLFVRFDVIVQVPKKSEKEESRVLAFSLKVEPPETFPIEERATPEDAAAGTPPPPPSDLQREDEHVYNTMIIKAFEHMSSRMLGVFFEPKTAAARAPEAL